MVAVLRGLCLASRRRKPEKWEKCGKMDAAFPIFRAQRGAGVEKKLTGQSKNGIVAMVIAAPHHNDI